MRAVWLGLCLLGCGTQFSDPIQRTSSVEAGEAGAATTSPDVCTGEPVQRLSGTNFATMTRLVQDDFTLELWFQTAQSLSGSGP